MLLSSGALIILIALSACEKKVTVVEGPKQSNLMTLLANNVLFNPHNTQDFQTALAIADTINFSNSSEVKTLIGLAHLYQGEVYEVTANILAQLQLDLFYKSKDAEHGHKFPITTVTNSVRDKLGFWMGLDAYAIYGKDEGDILFNQNIGDQLWSIKQTVKNYLSDNNDHSYYNHTLLMIRGNKLIDGVKKELPMLTDIFSAQRLFNDGKYAETLEYLDNEELFTRNIFAEHNAIQYYSSAVFKLAALAHYKLGIATLETALQSNYNSVDGVNYKIIAILNLCQKYYYFDDGQKIADLWDKNKNFLLKEKDSLKWLVKKNEKMAYSLDWIRFERAINSQKGYEGMPNEMVVINDSDLTYKIIKEFITNPLNENNYSAVQSVLHKLSKSPMIMNRYPTIISGFIMQLNLSPMARAEKLLVQDLTENLVFNVGYSENSWQRNRPAFLLALYGTLRWDGGRLPDCNGLMITLKNLDHRMNSFYEVAALFTQRLFEDVLEDV